MSYACESEGVTESENATVTSVRRPANRYMPRSWASLCGFVCGLAFAAAEGASMTVTPGSLTRLPFKLSPNLDDNQGKFGEASGTSAQRKTAP